MTLKRTGRIKPVNRKRRASEFERAYGSKERVAWIQAQPSVVSGERPCVNAHVRNGGAGRKADAKWIVPLTAQEHENYHIVGKRFFEKWGGNINLDECAAVIEARWQSRLAGEPIPNE